MPFYRLNAVIPRETSVAVHDECNVFWYWALSQGTNEHASKAHNAPFDRRRLQEPSRNARQMFRRHPANCRLIGRGADRKGGLMNR